MRVTTQKEGSTRLTAVRGFDYCSERIMKKKKVLVHNSGLNCVC